MEASSLCFDVRLPYADTPSDMNNICLPTSAAIFAIKLLAAALLFVGSLAVKVCQFSPEYLVFQSAFWLKNEPFEN